ncbi:hypothetical protein FPY71_07590 [Aureimonas fodinaquatilis]|uniref:DUF6894 domain-containing protein n=1 Tax=Aureimonas fodinaquatilis TaxID=2565783 RepID=A0A5B0DUC6_9HYPH|nr:hypothetical protein [Aureimonas fodinaquatilis]KAA0970374.1 hypothetical protein FPY71_07590 [Aureimonas fodinaquatilis]
MMPTSADNLQLRPCRNRKTGVFQHPFCELRVATTGDMQLLRPEKIMPKYHLNICCGDNVIVDLEGSELENLEKAQSEAVADARDMMSRAILDGRDLSSNHWIEIMDEHGQLVATVHFADTIET